MAPVSDEDLVVKLDRMGSSSLILKLNSQEESVRDYYNEEIKKDGYYKVIYCLQKLDKIPTAIGKL